MTKKYRVGIVGFGHMHVNHVAGLFAAHPQVQWAACADTRPLRPEARAAPYTRQWNLEHVTRTFGIPKRYDDYRQMLAEERLDVAVVTCENAQHAEVVEACAAAGTHVCVEKPMAASLSDALRIDRACRAAGVTMLVNWPVAWLPQARQAQQLLEQGIVGRVLEVRCRIGHTGPLGSGAEHRGVSETAAPMTGPERAATWWHQQAAGGGAMLDFCCYGAMFARWFVGQRATAAMGLKANLDSPWGDAEDNASILVRFPQAIAEFGGSWTTRYDAGLSSPVIFGTTGTMIVPLGEEKLPVRVHRGPGPAETFDPPPLPQGRTNVAEELIGHLDTAAPLHPTLQADFNLDVMAILDAGLRSAASGHLETVDSPAWCLG